MKVAVVSDIHSNIRAFREVLSRIDADSIICAGDLVGYYLHPGEVIDEVRDRDMTCVRGNHDHAVVDWPPGHFNPAARRALELNREKLDESRLSFLEDLPLRRELELDGTETVLVHGSPNDPSKYVYPRHVDPSFLERNDVVEEDIVVMGHTHVPFVKHVDGTLVLNPGSVGQPRDGNPGASYAVIDTGEMDATVRRVEYDLDPVVEEVGDSSLPDSLGERLRRGR
ncbi:MAG: metallophosphoesterase [Candidatus Nanohaloarchaea archaeon]